MTTCKIMLLGEMGVGKTSIAKQLVFGTFEGEYGSTIGVDIYTYDVVPAPGGQPFKFLIWDTDGSFGEAVFNMVYLKQAQAALVIGDASRPNTIASAALLAEKFTAAMPGRYLAVVLNKWDLIADDNRPDIPVALRSAAIPVIQTSAKTGFGVRALFHDAAATIMRRGQA
jgi:small GTP-binding protein